MATTPASRITASPARENATLTALELFAGAGGLAIGAHRSGLNVIDLIELDAACCQTLRANAGLMGWPESQEIEPRDVRKVDFSKYCGQVAILTAGAPCQPFSNGGKRRGRHDDRDMLPEVVRAVAECRPRAFVIENVRGLLFNSAIDYLKSTVARLRNPTAALPAPQRSEDLYHHVAPPPSDDDAYRVGYRLLNAADFGLAQARPRLFIVGVRRDQMPFAWPTRSHSRDSLIEDLRGQEYWLDHPETSQAARRRARALLPKAPLIPDGDRWRTLRDVISSLGPPARSLDAADDPAHVLVPGARLYPRHTGSRIDWVGKTVKAGVHGSPGGEHIVTMSPKRFRYLTVRECCELQGFPREYMPPDRRTPAMRQLGNAVPVNVAEAITGMVRRCLEGTDVNSDEEVV